MKDERIKEDKCISIAKLIKNILEHVIPDYNPVEDDGTIEGVLNGVIARSKLALFHVNALITEISAAERLAKIEALEEVVNNAVPGFTIAYVENRIAELKEEGE